MNPPSAEHKATTFELYPSACSNPYELRRGASDRRGDNEGTVAEGLEHTVLPITAAAAIMVAVFGPFVAGEVLEIKQVGFAMAVAILVDAILIRLVLVPAVMRLAGRANWWLPGPLTRRLPSLDHE